MRISQRDTDLQSLKKTGPSNTNIQYEKIENVVYEKRNHQLQQNNIVKQVQLAFGDSEIDVKFWIMLIAAVIIVVLSSRL
jgi:hypothetical protein